MVVAAVTTLLCRKLKQPVVLGYLLAGILIGPYTPPFMLVKNEATIATMSQLGVVLLLFSVGLHFSFRHLYQVGLTALVAAIVEIPAMFWLGDRLGLAFGWSDRDALFLGAIVSISSTTIIVKVLEGMGLIRQGFARLVFGILVLEDLVAVTMVGLLAGLGSGGGGLVWGQVGMQLAQLLIFLVTVGVVGFLTVPRLLGAVAKLHNDEAILITVLGLVFGMAILAERMGHGMALGAFLMGAVIAEVKQVHRIERLVAPVRDVFSALFFTATGMMIRFDNLPDHVGWVAGVVCLVIFGKGLFVSFGALLGGVDMKTALRSGATLGQIGEFSFILAALGSSVGANGDVLFFVAGLVSIVTTLTTPILMRGSDHLAEWVENKGPGWWSGFWKMYGFWLAGLRKNVHHQHHSAVALVKKLAWQIGFQFILVTGIFLVATQIWHRGGDLLPVVIRASGWGPTICWLGGAVLALPVLVAGIRKFQAFCMLLSEMALPRRTGGEDVTVARTVMSHSLSGLGLLLFLIYLIVLGAGLIPSMKILAILLVGLAILAGLSWKHLVRIYAQGQASIRETWEASPEPDHVRLPGNAEVKVYRVEKDSSLVGRTLMESGLRQHSGVVVVAIERKGGSVVSPGPDEKLHDGDQVFIFGEREQVHLADEYFGKCGVTAA